MRNQALLHAFERLPSTVLNTPLGRRIFKMLERSSYRKKPSRNK